jgi:hypothetical protein
MKFRGLGREMDWDIVMYSLRSHSETGTCTTSNSGLVQPRYGFENVAFLILPFEDVLGDDGPASVVY